MVTIGEYIQIKRLQKKLSVHELCVDICSPSTLSKIENNQINAKDEIINSLLLKVGKYDKEMIIENTKEIENICNDYFERLKINQDRDAIYSEIMDKAELFLNSLHLLTFYIAKIYKAYNLFDLKQIAVNNDALSLLNQHKQFCNPDELYFYHLVFVIHNSNIKDRVHQFNTNISSDEIGWHQYFLADDMFHLGKYLECIQYSQSAFQLACETCNIQMMYGCTLLLMLCILEQKQTNTKQLNHYLNQLKNLSYYLNYNFDEIINYNIGSTYLAQNKIDEAYTYLQKLEAMSFKEEKYSFLLHHKLAYLYTSMNLISKAKKHIEAMTNCLDQQESHQTKVCENIISSLNIKLNNIDYEDNPVYQKNIEYIFQHAEAAFSFGLKKFYFSDIEHVYLKQRRYKDLYLLYKENLKE